MIYKVVSEDEWAEAQASGGFRGSPIDLEDGFVHFSTADQLAETLAKHFAGKQNLLVLSVDEQQFGSELRWERSRGGSMFPHLYAVLPLEAVNDVQPLRLLPDGAHELPASVKASG